MIRHTHNPVTEPGPDERHNGWTNYETWRVWFDLTTNPPFYQFWLGSAHDQIKRHTERTGRDGHDVTTLENLKRAGLELALEMANTYEQLITPLKDATRPALASDLAVAALSLVNWNEIAAWLTKQAIPELKGHFAKVTTQPVKAIEVPVRVVRMLPSVPANCVPEIGWHEPCNCDACRNGDGH